MYLVQTRTGEFLQTVTIQARGLRTVAIAKAKARELRRAGHSIVQIDRES